MPISIIIAFFVTGLAIFALGSPLGAIFLVMGAIAVSLKLGMRVTTQGRDDRIRVRTRPHR